MLISEKRLPGFMDETPKHLDEVPSSAGENLNRIGKSIREARLEKGWTQQQLSEAVGIKYNAACSWENGTKKVTSDLAEKLQNVLPLPADLFENTDELAQKKKSKGQRIMHEVADRVKELRIKYRYSMREMADMLGIIPSHYFRVEKHLSSFTLGQVIDISKRFGVTTDWILKGVEPPKVPYAELEAKVRELEEKTKLMQMIIDQKEGN